MSGEKQIVNVREWILMLSGFCCKKGFGGMFWLNVCFVSFEGLR